MNSRLAQLLALLIISGCGQATQSNDSSAAPLKSSQDTTRLFLPEILNEVSGLTEAADGGLLLHNDEFGMVYHLTYATGVLKPFASFGQPPMQADFEGIATLGDRLYLMTSKGTLYSRATTAELTETGYEKHKTGLKNTCEFEGLDSLPTAKLLALACKKSKKKRDAGKLAVYFWSPETRKIKEESTLKIDLDGVLDEAHPSAIHWREDQKQFVVLAAKERSILSFSATGDLISQIKLPDSKTHPQAEGLTLANNTVYIADESAAGQPAQISRYPLRQIDGLLRNSAR